MTGRLYNETAGKISALLVFLGFNMTFFIQFIMGSQGMPRRYYDYPDMPWLEPLHQASTIGSYVLGIGLAVVLWNGIWSWFKGKPAPGNPWGGATLEWTHTTSPPDHHNFHHTPLVTHGPYDYEVLFRPSGDSMGRRPRRAHPQRRGRRSAGDEQDRRRRHHRPARLLLGA